MTFDDCIKKLLVHEGDFSDHEADPGGKTRYGVTEAVAREVGYRGDMRELPLDLAKRIYRERYWNAVRADELPAAIRYAMFDAAVNSGPRQAIIWLQRALGVTADGVLGPVTLGKAAEFDGGVLCSRLLAQRLRFMTGLNNWQAFGRGWARRIADLMEVSA
jgi:lysozyme family protein